MSVYVDSGAIKYGRMKMCHMVADTLDELHGMADRIGIQRRWFQDAASAQHYDICQSKRKLAVEAGAIEADRVTFVGVIRRLRAERWHCVVKLPHQGACGRCGGCLGKLGKPVMTNNDASEYDFDIEER